VLGRVAAARSSERGAPSVSRALLLFVGALSSFACDGETVLRPVDPSGFFDPAEIAFGERSVGMVHELRTTLRNTSAEPLRVQAIRFEPATEVFLVRPEEGGTLRGTVLAPGARLGLVVLYRPIVAGRYDTTLVLASDAFEVRLPIRAQARALQPAVPQLTPNQVAFAGTEVGREVAQTVVFTNAGDVGGTPVLLRPPQAPFSLTRLDGSPLAFSASPLPPGQSLSFQVRYAPEALGASMDEAVLAFDSGAQATLALSGEALSAGTLECPPSLSFGAVPRGAERRATLVCGNQGGPYTLSALRIAGGGSGAFTLPAARPTIAAGEPLTLELGFVSAGLAGPHSGVLELVAAHGPVTRVELSAEVVPPAPGASDLALSLSWNTGFSDFDLHLVRDGAQPFASGDDCYFEEKNPSWGAPDDLVDDPYLDRDDRDGFGPEQLNLTRASEARYDVYVQFFDFTGDASPTSTVRLAYQLRGGAPVELTRDLSRCGDTWHVGRVVFDGGPRFVRVDALLDTWRGRAAERCR
jgi:hypothetical protein